MNLKDLKQEELEIMSNTDIAYYILKGKGQVFDSGELHEVNVGDVIYTADGNKHYIENIGDEDLEFIAVVINE